MRKASHFGLSALIAIVSISAPFAHTHDSGKAEEHLAREHFSVLHSHIPLPSKDPALAQVDISARRVNWYHFEHKKIVALAEPPSTAARVLEAPKASEGFTGEESATLPEEFPPRAISPRGPPSLFA